MIPATQEEVDRVTEYVLSQAPDLKVEFVQKVYSENVLHVLNLSFQRHDMPSEKHSAGPELYRTGFVTSVRIRAAGSYPLVDF